MNDETTAAQDARVYRELREAALTTLRQGIPIVRQTWGVEQSEDGVYRRNQACGVCLLGAYLLGRPCRSVTRPYDAARYLGVSSLFTCGVLQAFDANDPEPDEEQDRRSPDFLRGWVIGRRLREELPELQGEAAP